MLIGWQAPCDEGCRGKEYCFTGLCKKRVDGQKFQVAATWSIKAERYPRQVVDWEGGMEPQQRGFCFLPPVIHLGIPHGILQQYMAY